LSVAERIEAVRGRLAAAERAFGRPSGSVRLVAVGKTVGVEPLRQAVAAGAVDIGENYAQELRDKAPAVPGATWHFIGRLQRNKARYVAAAATWMHALDDLAVAQALAERRLGPPLRVLVAVNAAGESTKGGLKPEEALPFCAGLARWPALQLCGLMTMPPPSDDPEDAAPSFRLVAQLAGEGRRRGLPLDELSMGMSGDLEVAVREGATIVRVGAAIFGPRG
jgi:pyridoxal phosphate enzyme (YggS family)